MKKTFIVGSAPGEDELSFLSENGLELVGKPCEADILLYEGGLLEALEGADLSRLWAVVPFKTALAGNKVGPEDLRGQRMLGRESFENENIGGVSGKIGRLVDSLDVKGQFSEISRFLKSNAIELVQNALIFKRSFGGEGEVELEVFESDTAYNIQVTDNFGALTRETILTKIRRAWTEKTCEDKETGAGLGLFMVLMASDAVVFKLKNLKQTRVCCIINKYKRLRHYKNKSPALFILKE